MKKYNFYLTVPKNAVDYVIDKCKERNIQILTKKLRILTNPYITLGYCITVSATEEEFADLTMDMISF